MPYATLNGIRVHYEAYGAGYPMLLIYGLGGPAVSWLYQVRDLSTRYRVITFDNRGVGETDLPEETAYPTGQMAEDARALPGPPLHLGAGRRALPPYHRILDADRAHAVRRGPLPPRDHAVGVHRQDPW